MELAENIRQLHELSTRIDERLKYMIERHSVLSDKIDFLMSKHNDMATRVAIIEATNVGNVKETVANMDKRLLVMEKHVNTNIMDAVDMLQNTVHTLEISNEHNTSYRTRGESRIGWWADIIMKLVIALIGAAIFWKLGLKI